MSLAMTYNTCYKKPMGTRTALIISCSRQEADTTREQAALQRRTMSAYILHIVMRHILVDESLFRTREKLAPPNGRLLDGLAHPRTTMLIRCSTEEAARIRAAVKRQDSTISGFVLHALGSSWDAAEGIPARRPPQKRFHVGQVIRANLPLGVLVTVRIKSILGQGGAARLEVEDQNHRTERIYPWQVVDVI
jgi:hypothetical protein